MSIGMIVHSHVEMMSNHQFQVMCVKNINDSLHCTWRVVGQKMLLRLLDLVLFLVIDMLLMLRLLLLPALFPLRPLVALPGNEQPAGE